MTITELVNEVDAIHHFDQEPVETKVNYTGYRFSGMSYWWRFYKRQARAVILVRNAG